MLFSFKKFVNVFSQQVKYINFIRKFNFYTNNDNNKQEEEETVKIKRKRDLFVKNSIEWKLLVDTV